MKNLINLENPIQLAGVQFFSDDANPLSLRHAWQYFESVVRKIPSQLGIYNDKVPSYAICQNFNEEGIHGFTYFIGVPVTDFSNLPVFAVARTITSGKYLSAYCERLSDIQHIYETLRRGLQDHPGVKPGLIEIEVYKPKDSGVEVWQSMQYVNLL